VWRKGWQPVPRGRSTNGLNDMTSCLLTAICLCLAGPIAVAAAVPATAARDADRPRLLVLTDISNEPDDEESLVRLLVYSNEFDIEGLVATTSTWLKAKPREDLIRRDIAAYAQVRPNLLKHATGFPLPDQLHAVTCTGQTEFGMNCVAPGERSTAGSRRIIDAADRADDRPLWVSVWGGANTLAQALADVRATRSRNELDRFVARLRVYTISDQDDAGPWLRREFPNLFYVVSPSADGHEYYRATWTGISGDRHYKNGLRVDFDLVDNPWLEAHVIKNHGPLGALYPKLAYIMEGDTPSFLGLIDNGLGWRDRPSFGGWGGRYALYRPSGEARPIWANNDDSRDTMTIDASTGATATSDQATIWRWRKHYQHDFAARMNWCVADSFEKANHNPVPVLNGDRTNRVLTLPASGGSTISLSAEGTNDLDGNAVRVTWWIYPEAGTIRSGASLSSAEGMTTEVHVPPVKKAGTLHVILQAEDDGDPHLFAYRRAVLEVTP
jgi:hypothetical protein